MADKLVDIPFGPDEVVAAQQIADQMVDLTVGDITFAIAGFLNLSAAKAGLKPVELLELWSDTIDAYIGLGKDIEAEEVDILKTQETAQGVQCAVATIENYVKGAELSNALLYRLIWVALHTPTFQSTLARAWITKDLKDAGPVQSNLERAFGGVSRWLKQHANEVTGEPVEDLMGIVYTLFRQIAQQPPAPQLLMGEIQSGLFKTSSMELTEITPGVAVGASVAAIEAQVANGYQMDMKHLTHLLKVMRQSPLYNRAVEQAERDWPSQDGFILFIWNDTVQNADFHLVRTMNEAISLMRPGYDCRFKHYSPTRAQSLFDTIKGRWGTRLTKNQLSAAEGDFIAVSKVLEADGGTDDLPDVPAEACRS